MTSVGLYLNEATETCVSWSHTFESFTVAPTNWLTVTKWQLICSVSHNYNPILTSFMNNCRLYNTTVSAVVWELLTFLEYASSLPVCCGTLLLCLLCMYVCIMFCISFSVGQSAVCPSIYGFELPLFYLQTFSEKIITYLIWKNIYNVCFTCVPFPLKNASFTQNTFRHGYSKIHRSWALWIKTLSLSFDVQREPV